MADKKAAAAKSKLLQKLKASDVLIEASRHAFGAAGRGAAPLRLRDADTLPDDVSSGELTRSRAGGYSAPNTATADFGYSPVAPVFNDDAAEFGVK